MGDISRILVTGANGFLGRAVVSEAIRRGMDVVAVVRSEQDGPECWRRESGLSRCCIDLAKPEAMNALMEAVGGVDAVIHAASAIKGGEAVHQSDTVAATRTVIDALRQRNSADAKPRRLVLVSSFSVYGYSALPDGVVLDERTPVESSLDDRDAYCRAKLAQERLCIYAAQKEALRVRIARVGALYGPQRSWSARLGFKAFGMIISPGGKARVPVIFVETCARALVHATTKPFGSNDAPILGGEGCLDIINLIDSHSPTQMEWLKQSRQGPVIAIPWKIFWAVSRSLGFLAALSPKLAKRVPLGLREASLAARFKPLRYSNARAQDRLFLGSPGSKTGVSFRSSENCAAMDTWQ